MSIRNPLSSLANKMMIIPILKCNHLFSEIRLIKAIRNKEKPANCKMSPRPKKKSEVSNVL